jgi:hypothetical protein
MTADELIEEYKHLTQNCYDIDYGDKKAVRKNNDSATRMYQIVETIISKFGAEGISKLKPLLDIADFRIDLWIATHLLEKVSLDKETEKKAFSIIEKVAAGDDVLALGYQYWIKDWKLKRSK